MLERQHRTHPLDGLTQTVGVDELVAAQDGIKDVHVDQSVSEYIIAIVDATRHHEDVQLGASPRGSLALYNAARARASINGRLFVVPDDVKVLAEPTLAHRVIVTPSARVRNVDSRTIIHDVVRTIPVPGARPIAQPRGVWAAS